jgi:hypothetical protein
VKKVTLSPTQVRLVREDIESTLEYLDVQLTSEPEHGCEWPHFEREAAILEANECRDLLRQLKETA